VNFGAILYSPIIALIFMHSGAPQEMIMLDHSNFQGFPKGTTHFLLDLRDHNERAWFSQHKQDYETYLQAPARAFSAAMAYALETRLAKDLATHRVQHSIFRIYRDTRFSEDKTPYKTHLGIWFWQGDLPKMENSGFYFQLEPPNLMLAVGIYMFTRPWLQAYRDAVADSQMGTELAGAIQDILQKGDYSLGGKHYQRVPRGFDPAHPLAELLLYNGLYVSHEKTFPEALYSPALIDYCIEKYLDMTPLHAWLIDMLEMAKA
jgi:uncharacterized protein (TIGR02453 family)